MPLGWSQEDWRITTLHCLQITSNLYMDCCSVYIGLQVIYIILWAVVMLSILKRASKDGYRGGLGGLQPPPPDFLTKKLPLPLPLVSFVKGEILAPLPLSREYCQRGKIWVPPPPRSWVWSEGKNLLSARSWVSSEGKPLPPSGREFRQRRTILAPSTRDSCIRRWLFIIRYFTYTW